MSFADLAPVERYGMSKDYVCRFMDDSASSEWVSVMQQLVNVFPQSHQP